MNRRKRSSMMAATLFALILSVAAPVLAYADITSAVEGSEGTVTEGSGSTSGIATAAVGTESSVAADTGTSNIVQAGVVEGAVGTIVAGEGQAVSGISSSGSGTSASGIATAAEGSASAGASSSSSSGVVTAGSSSGNYGPSSSSSGSSATVGGVVMAGSTGVSGVATEGEKNSSYGDILGGATLIMFNSVSDSQILSCMIQTNDGSLIIVDGGFGEDADYLTSQIVARGGHVAAWLITHPHADHVGALYRILQDQDAQYAAGIDSPITIDGIYYSFGDENWYLTNDPDESTMAISLIGELSGRPAAMLHSVHQGETFYVDTATVQVLNDRYTASSDKGNNAGIVYKVTVNGVSILFLGDMSQEGGNVILQKVGAGALKSDIVQMAHHGQNGVGQEFYQAVSPSICLWPTPSWLWVSQESKYTIQQTKQWMMELGVQRHYCMKDGDQIIR